MTTYNDLVGECVEAMKEKRKQDFEILQEIVMNFKDEQQIGDFLYPYFKQGFSGYSLMKSIFLFYREYTNSDRPHPYDKILEVLKIYIEDKSNNRYTLLFDKNSAEVLLALRDIKDANKLSMSGQLYHYSNEHQRRQELKEKLENLKTLIISRQGLNDQINVVSQLPKDILEKVIKDYF